MKLRKLIIENFGPFPKYEITFPSDDTPCILLTGKNNEGKSTIISALKLLNNATKVVKKSNTTFPKDLLKQDTENIQIGKLLHNYKGDKAKITGIFSNDFNLEVTLDESQNRVYCEHSHNVPKDITSIFGVIPPLGLLVEEEFLISNISHLTKSLSTSLAPRHLRNHFYHFLSPEEYSMIQEIIRESWENISLQNFEYDNDSNRLICFYNEGRIQREICWAGQGLQVWFQIITHLVRLRNTSILILDEPEIFLHPQKQHELVRILREYYSKSIIVATHSIELMNSVDISHIIHVIKTQEKPQIKSSTDKYSLESVRSHVGSSFNLFASQFDNVDALIFTEDTDDFYIINRLAIFLNMHKNVFNIPIHGFPQYKVAIYYKNAYEKFFGKNIACSILLDWDYYPENHLLTIIDELNKHGIKTYFTPGKEIENIFLDEKILTNTLSMMDQTELMKFLDSVYDSLFTDCLGSYVSIFKELDRSLDQKTIIKKYYPTFESSYKNIETRSLWIDGKEALKLIRSHVKEKYNVNLTTNKLIENVPKSKYFGNIKLLVSGIYQLKLP